MTPQEEKRLNKLANIEIIEAMHIATGNIIDEINHIKKTREIKESSDAALKYARHIEDMASILYERKNKGQFK